MKYFLSLLSVFVLLTSWSQEVRFMSKEEVQKMDFSKITYLNASSEKKSTFTKGDLFFIDFNNSDANTDADEMVVLINGIKFVSNSIVPFQVSGIEEDCKVKINLKKDGEVIPFKAKGGSMKIDFFPKPSILNDTIVFGLLAILLAIIFYTSNLEARGWKRFYRILPALLLCYILPALLSTLGIISNEYSDLYTMSKNYLLPGALVLMTLGIDFKGLVNLGPKALIMFITATVGIIIGGPIAIMIFKTFAPEVVGGIGNDATWRGMATIAGSWIGGGANQAAMLETYQYNPDLYGKMVTVDIVVANMWMAFLLWSATRADKVDKWLKADSSAIEDLKVRTMNYQSSINRSASLTDYMMILGIAFGAVALSHFFGSDVAAYFGGVLGEESPFASSFFWIVVIATTAGLLMSLTKLRKYEGAGASKIGSVFIYILVATIGMNMELEEAVKEPMLILVGIVWMLIHIGLLFLVAKIIKAPFFFVAVGSKANIGGAASAPVVAAAFHPSLASVGAILAVLGYALGTYGAIVAAELMQSVAP
ncbi:MAG: putative membrane protein [Lentimonas sp.]|jgi:uncharacterized membrane protein